MPDFNWLANPRNGGCLGCLTQSNDRGFVDTWAEVMVSGGVQDVVFCADCIHLMGRLVGMATPQETEKFALREYELVEQNEKLKDEAVAWRQRMERLLDLKVEDLDMPSDEIVFIAPPRED